MLKIRAGQYQSYCRDIVFTVTRGDTYGWSVEMEKGWPIEVEHLATRGTKRECKEEIRDYLIRTAVFH